MTRRWTSTWTASCRTSRPRRSASPALLRLVQVLDTGAGGAAPCGDGAGRRLGLAQRPQDVAAGELAALLLAPAGAGQLGEHGRIAGGVLQPRGHPPPCAGTGGRVLWAVSGGDGSAGGGEGGRRGRARPGCGARRAGGRGRGGTGGQAGGAAASPAPPGGRNGTARRWTACRSRS